MSEKILKKLVAVILSALILFGCAPSVFAATSGDGIDDVPVYTSARDILAMVVAECADVDERDYAPGSYRLFTQAYENAVNLLNDDSATDKQLENAYMNLLGEKVRMITVDRETGERSRTEQWLAGYEYGAVLVNLRPDSPKIQTLLSDFDIASVSLYPYDNTGNTIVYVRFKEKTTEIVDRAIEVLKASSCVYSAEPHYWMLFDFIPDDGPRYRLEDEVKAYSLVDANDYTEESFRTYTLAYEKAVELLANANATDEQLEAAYSELLKAKFYLVKATEPTEPTTSEPLEEEKEDEFEPGAVLVGLNSNASFEQLLPGFEIVEIRLLTPGLSNLNIYYVRFAEKTKEIVWRAIEVLEQSSDVIYAEPNYYDHFDVIPTETETKVTEPSEPTITEATKGEGIYTEEEEKAGYEFGVVVVRLNPGFSPTIETLLADFEIESISMMPGLLSGVHYVKFVEKTKEIVWRAIEVLQASPYVEFAEPSPIYSVDGTPDSTQPDTNVTESSEQTTESEPLTEVPTVTDPTEPAPSNSPETTEPTEPSSDKETDSTETTLPTKAEEVTDPTETAQPTTSGNPILPVVPTDATTTPTDIGEYPGFTNPTADETGATTDAIETTAPTDEVTEPTTESIQPTTSPEEHTEPATDCVTKAKKPNKMKVTVATKTVKAKKLKRAKVTVKAITVKNNNGAVTFSKVAKKSSSRLTVNAKTGKITVKKDTKKGTYKIKVKICAKGTKNYKPKTLTKTVTIKVSK